MGMIGGLGARWRSMMGGEVEQITSVIRDGRVKALKRMMKEAEEAHGYGVTGVEQPDQVHARQRGICHARLDGAARGRSGQVVALQHRANAQELFCQLDAGFMPIEFVFGNVAYSVGVGRGIIAGFKTMKRGEIKEYSNVLNKTHHLALKRILKEAKEFEANAVIGIETTVMPFKGVHEMVMSGTAAKSSKLPPEYAKDPVSSDLTAEELWNLTNMGYAPLKLVMGTAVYSLGWSGGISAWFKSFSKGEIATLTSLIYDAREHAIGLIRDEADDIGRQRHGRQEVPRRGDEIPVAAAAGHYQ